MIHYRLTEIFYSLQGEGRWTGTPAIFVRFAGCNESCSFCDTDFSPRLMMTQKEILSEVQHYPAKHIILTGGEPTLQLTQSLIDALHEQGYILHLETNGVNLLEVTGMEWVTVSPKQPGLGWRIRKGHELKVVYQGQSLLQYNDSQFDFYYLQPCSMQNIPETIEQVKRNPKWTLSLQMHKLLDIP